MQKSWPNPLSSHPSNPSSGPEGGAFEDGGPQRRILDLFAGAVQILAGGVEGFEKIHAFTAARTARFLDG